MGTRRTTELWLLIAATPVLLLLFTMLLVNEEVPLTVASFAVPIGLIIAFAVAHVFMRRFVPAADPGILPIAYLLAGIGICFLLRLAPEAAMKQVVWLFVGVGLMIATIILVPSIERLGRYKYTCLLLGIVLLLLPVLPFIGHEANGSRIWIQLGGFSFQPGEIAKICIVLFLAAYLADNREMLSVLHSTRIGLKLPDFRTLLPLLVMWVIALLVVIFEKDLGSALLLFGIFLAMLYVCTGRLAYVVIGIVLVAVGGTGLYMVFDHVQTRIAIWRDPWADAQDKGYQLVQSLYSLADGGLVGTGIGRGMSGYIPEVHNDFIFSAIAEETGLLGGAGLIILYLLFAVRGFATAARAKSDVAAFAAAGLTTSISLQAFIIVGGVTGFIPLTGITLPFISQGGSSLLSSFIIVGLLLCAGNEGTGLETEMTTGHLRIGAQAPDTGVLGRTALGKRLTALITVFAVLFALLIANLTYVQMFRAEAIQTMPGNNHTLQKEAGRERGTILTSDNVTLAKSVKSGDDTYERQYPQGSLASHVVGYSSQRFGSSGVENTMGATLTGNDSFETIGDAIRSYAGIKNPGNDVVLTIDSRIQREAESVLAGEKGACVVLDTKTGAVLAEASAPTYDASDIGGILEGTAEGELTNRATQSLYAPGSTFKTVTLAAALDTGTVTASSVYNSPASIDIGNAEVTNYHKTASGKVTVEDATKISSNTVFAQIADELGSKALVDYAEGFGFNGELGQDFATATSLMPDPAEMTRWETAWAGVGQPVGEHASPAGPQTTVMQMAVVMQTIANGGTALDPYLVKEVLAPSGTKVAETAPRILGKPISKKTAKAERKILEAVVDSGTGTAAQISGAKVIGKTGTAETDKKKSDAWFVGTASVGKKSVTIAIVVEQGDSGGGVAAPKAGEVLYTALDALGAW